jgi:hypothetical protein
MGLTAETLRVIEPLTDPPARRPWVDLGTAQAKNREVLLELSGRSVGLLAIKLQRQP